MEEGAKEISHHKVKVYAYRKARRLMRIGNRKHSTRRDLFDGFTADAWFSLTESGEKEEGNEEETNKDRLEKNKEWRRRKEAKLRESQGLPPPEDPEVIKEKNRKVARKLEKKLHKEFLCTNCRKELVNEAWECLEGHATCIDCFDKENIGRDTSDQSMDEDEDDLEGGDVITALKKISRKNSKFSSRSRSSLDTLKRIGSNTSVGTVASIETIISLRESLADIADGDDEVETKSFQRYLINEIDFFLDTLEVRGDAITFYNDYNNANKSIFYNPDLEGISLDGDNNQNMGMGNNAYVDEKTERVRKYIERLNDQGGLASLRETIVDVMETNDADMDPSWAKFRLEEVDFFLNTLNIRKDAIGYYKDYHNGFKSIFDYVPDEDNSNGDDSEAGMGISCNESESDDERITRCKICNNYILRRNILVEKLARIFFNKEI